MGLFDALLGGVTGFLSGGPVGAVAGALGGLGGGSGGGGGSDQGGGNQNEANAGTAQGQQMAIARQNAENAQNLFGAAQPTYGPLLNMLRQTAVSPQFAGPSFSQNWGDYGGAGFGQGAPSMGSFYGPLMGAVIGNYGLGRAQGYEDPFMATQSSPFGFSRNVYGVPSNGMMPQQNPYGASPWGIPNGSYGSPNSPNSSMGMSQTAIPGLPDNLQVGNESEAQRLAFAQANPNLQLLHGWGQAGNKEAIEGAMNAARQNRPSGPSAPAPTNFLDALRGLQNAPQAGQTGINWNGQPFGYGAGNPQAANTANTIGGLIQGVGNLFGGGGGQNVGGSVLGSLGGNNYDLGGNYSVQLPF